MKRNILFVVFVAALANVTANLYGQFTYFEAEGFLYNESRGGCPGTKAEFYSKPWGGTLLFSESYNQEGKVVFKSGLDKQPAFVLNTLVSKGHGKVTFLGERDFSFNNFSVMVTEGKTTIEWYAAVHENLNISFVIQQSTDGEKYTDVMTINGQHSGHEIAYKRELGNCNSAIYRIRINELNTGSTRYITQPKTSICENKLTLFPTVSDVTITIAYEGFTGKESYQIVDMQGAVVRTGLLQTEKRQFDISELTAGVYLFQVLDGKSHKTAKFIKN